MESVDVSTTFVSKRWDQILGLLDMQGEVSVEDIAAALGVSESTVRRDLASINDRGLIKRTRGGATMQANPYIGPTFAESRRCNPSEKKIIGKAAAALVSNGSTLMLDGGFTTYQVARHLRANNLTVISNSLDVVRAIAGQSSVSIVCIGGELSVASGTNLGTLTETQIGQYCADMAIVGADGVSLEHGLTSPNPGTCHTKRAMIAASRELVVVADYTKLNKLCPYRVVGCDKITTLVTDNKANKDVLQAFNEMGVNVVIADTGDGSDPR